MDLPTPPLPVRSSAPSSVPMAAACSSCAPVWVIHQWKSVRSGELLVQYGSVSADCTQNTPEPRSRSSRFTENSAHWKALRMRSLVIPQMSPRSVKQSRSTGGGTIGTPVEALSHRWKTTSA